MILKSNPKHSISFHKISNMVAASCITNTLFENLPTDIVDKINSYNHPTEDEDECEYKKIHSFVTTTQQTLISLLDTGITDIDNLGEELLAVWGPFPSIAPRHFLTLFFRCITNNTTGYYEINNLDLFIASYRLFLLDLRDEVDAHLPVWRSEGSKRFREQLTEKRAVDWLDWKWLWDHSYNSVVAKIFNELYSNGLHTSDPGITLTTSPGTTSWCFLLCRDFVTFIRMTQPVIMQAQEGGTLSTNTEEEWLFTATLSWDEVEYVPTIKKINCTIFSAPYFSETYEASVLLGFHTGRSLLDPVSIRDTVVFGGSTPPDVEYMTDDED